MGRVERRGGVYCLPAEIADQPIPRNDGRPVYPLRLIAPFPRPAAVLAIERQISVGLIPAPLTGLMLGVALRVLLTPERIGGVISMRSLWVCPNQPGGIAPPSGPFTVPTFRDRSRFPPRCVLHSKRRQRLDNPAFAADPRLFHNSPILLGRQQAAINARIDALARQRGQQQGESGSDSPSL
jgi:hypothetical protein